MLGRTHVVFVVGLSADRAASFSAWAIDGLCGKAYALYLRALVLHNKSNLEQKYQPNVMSALER